MRAAARAVALVLLLGAAAWAQQLGELDLLLELMRQRLELAPAVARYKWNQGLAIEDKVREEQLLEQVGAGRPEFVRRFFQDQIEAGKLVQAGLFEVWKTSPPEPGGPDLARDLRPRIDRLTQLLVEALLEVWPARQGPDWARQLEQRAALLPGPAAARERALRTLLGPVTVP